MNYYNYFTEIEEHFVRRRGKHMYVSPLDWSLIATWRDSRIPLHVALRGIDLAMDNFYASPHRRRNVYTLFYCHDAVMQEYARYLESRIGEASDGTGAQAGEPAVKHSSKDEIGPNLTTILDFLGSRISEINGLRVKHYGEESAQFRQGLERVAARLDEINRDLQGGHALDYEALERDLALVDETLVSELSPIVPAEEMESWKEEAKKDLKTYRKRLPKETYQKIQDHYLRRKIHQRFGVGELSLFHL